MKIAFLTPSLPWPAHSGGKIKSFKMIEYMSKNHLVDLYTVVSDDDQSSLADFQQRFPSVPVVVVEGKKNRTLKNLLLSYLINKPLSVFRNYFPQMQDLIAKKSFDYDIIFVDHFLMFQYVPKHCRAKIIVHQHNAEFVMWERYAALLPSSIKKIAVQFEAWRIKNYERKLCQRANIIMAAPNDCHELQRLSPISFPFVETLHLSDESLLSIPRHFSSSSTKVLYVGTLSWEANWDGLMWFLQHIWPSIIQNNHTIKLQIIGKANEMQRKKLSTFPQVDVLGFVENLDQLFDQALCFIAPLRFGSGIKVKVIEALYRGMAIVTTSIGAEGIGLTNNENVLIADSADEQAAAIKSLLDSPVLAESIGANARNYASSHLRWKKVFENLEKALWQ